MSRYSFNPIVPAGIDSDALEGLSIVVGWDNPLQTLFGDVEDAKGDPIVSTMLDMGKTDVNTVLELEALLGYRVPNDIALKLCEDMANRTEPSPLQKRMAGILKA
jgi:hypothetical protein